MKPYDLLIIGGGSAGYNAARVAAGLGQRVAVADGARQLSGLCILKGCMPSKTLIYAAEVLHRAQTSAALGLKIPRAAADMKAVHARKLAIIGDFARYRTHQILTGKFKLYRSNARFVDAHTVELADGRKLRARHFLIATGSRVSTPPVPGLDTIKCWTSDDVLDLDFAPRSVVVLGCGVVASELAQYLKRIGSRVTILQRSRHILGSHSAEASQVVEKAFRDEGIELFTSTKIVKVAPSSVPRRGATAGVRVSFLHQGKIKTRTAAHCFNAMGREANTGGLNLAAAGVRTNPDGQTVNNRWQQTSVPHIYSAGDCAGPVEIVHIAIQQGELAARHAAGVKGLKPVDFSLLLNVVFTDPQLASIGRTAAELDARGIPYLSASYPFDDHGKSILMNAPYGWVKVMAEPKRGRILGAEIVGRDAGELVHCFSGPLAMRATVFDLLRAPWYHPTLSEIITYPLEEIAEAIAGKPVSPR